MPLNTEMDQAETTFIMLPTEERHETSTSMPLHEPLPAPAVTSSNDEENNFSGDPNSILCEKLA